MYDPSRKSTKKKLLDLDIFIDNMTLDELKGLIQIKETPQIDKFFYMVNTHVVMAVESKIEELEEDNDQDKDWN